MKALNVLKYVGFAILGLGFVTLAVFLTMWLWNSLVPVLFHGPVLTFWQTAGLFILSKILLTGVAPGGSKKHNRRDWRKKYHERHHNNCCEEEKIAAPEQA